MTRVSTARVRQPVASDRAFVRAGNAWQLCGVIDEIAEVLRFS
jgi:hypothetical protein